MDWRCIGTALLPHCLPACQLGVELLFTPHICCGFELISSMLCMAGTADCITFPAVLNHACKHCHICRVCATVLVGTHCRRGTLGATVRQGDLYV